MIYLSGILQRYHKILYYHYVTSTIWLSSAGKIIDEKISSGSNVVIEDIRYDDEKKGIVVKITNGEEEKLDDHVHDSEKGVNANIVIVNYGTIEELHQKIRDIVIENYNYTPREK